ncbi:MAG: outer membrane protein transport protein [Lentisphaerota bacterium]
MGRSYSSLGLFLLLWLVSCRGLMADGFRNPPASGAGLGRSGAIIAQVDDASAVSYNPANLAVLRKPSILAALTLASSRTELTTPQGMDLKSDSAWQYLPNLFAAYPLENNMAFGLGLTTPFGQSAEWSDLPAPLRYAIPYSAEVRLLNINPAFAASFKDFIFIGIGIDGYVSDLDIRQAYPWGQAASVPGLPDGDARMKGEGSGWGANAGITVKILERHRLALTYRSPVQVDYDGHFEISGIPPLPTAGALSPRSDFSTRIDYPAMAGLGYGWDLHERVQVEVDVEWLQWSRYDRMNLDAANNTMLLPAAEIRNDWKDTWTAGISAAWKMTPNWTLRAGYSFLESPIPDDTFTPTIPDSDRHTLTAGLGFEHGAHRADIAAAASFFADRSIANNQNPLLNGDYSFSGNLIGASYQYSF